MNIQYFCACIGQVVHSDQGPGLYKKQYTSDTEAQFGVSTAIEALCA